MISFAGFWNQPKRLAGRACLWPAVFAVLAQVCGALPAQPLTLEDAFNRFVERSPLAAAEREKLETARGRLRQSAAWSNPVLHFSQEGYPIGRDGSGFDDQEFLLAAWQEFELGGKRGRRRELARLELEAATARYQDFLRQSKLDLSRLFVEAFHALRRRDALRSSLEQYGRVCETHRRRYERGEVSGLAHLKLEGEEIWYLVQLSRAEREWNRAWSELAARIGWETDSLPELRLQLPDPADLPPAVVLVETALKARPDLVAARLETRVAEAAVALERAENKPSLNVGGGYKRDFGQHSFFVGVQLPIPLWDRRQGAIVEKTAVGRRQAMLSEWEEIQVRREVEQAHSICSGLLDAWQRVNAGLLQKLERTVAITAVSYQHGEAGIVEYLDALRAHRDALLEFDQLAREIQLAWLELEASVGSSLGRMGP